jgi:hypothetical protein
MSSFRKSFTVKTKAAGTVVDGFFVEGSVTTSTIQASLQPLKPEDIQQLPEGRRNSKLFFLITSSKLNLITSANPSIVTVDTEDYEVDKEEIWQNNVINHYKYLIIKIND